MRGYPLGIIMIGVALICATPIIIQFYLSDPSEALSARAPAFVVEADFIPYPYERSAYKGKSLAYKPTFFFGRMCVSYIFQVRGQTIRSEQSSLPFLFFLSFYPNNVSHALKEANAVAAYDPHHPASARLVNLIVPFINLMVLDGIVLFFVALIPLTLQAMSFDQDQTARQSAQASEDYDDTQNRDSG